MDRTESTAGSRGPSFPPAMLVGIYGLFDFLAPAIAGPLAEGNRVGEELAIAFATAIVGCALAQFGALAVWGVMGTGRPIARWAGSLATAAVLLGCLFAGAKIGTKGGLSWREFGEFLQVVPLAYLSVQIPLWTMSVGWGWRLVAAGAVAPPPQRFTLRGLFFATAVVAATLALLQLGQPAESRGEAIAVIAFCLIGGPIWSIVTVLPCLLSAFLPSTPHRGVKFLLAYGAALSLALVGAALAMGGPNSAAPDFGFVAIYGTFCGAVAFTLFGSFLVLRNDGYRLRRVKIEAPVSQTVDTLG
jgi:hypothetical protein